MIVKVYLQPENKYIGRGEIDPKSNFSKIKEEIVTAFNLGDPNDFYISVSSFESLTPSDKIIRDGDSIYLIKINNAYSFKRLPD